MEIDGMPKERIRRVGASTRFVGARASSALGSERARPAMLMRLEHLSRRPRVIQARRSL